MSAIKHLRLKRFLAKYINYVTWGGYAMVIAVTATVIALWFVRINLYCNSVATERGLLKPREYAAKATSDTVVLRYLVPNGEDVEKGQALVEYCDDPAWVARLRAAEHLRALADDLEQGGVALPDGLGAEGARAQSESLEALRSSPPFRHTFQADGSGIVVLSEATEGTVVPGGQALATVNDLGDLRVSIKMAGANVNGCAIGREALVEIKNRVHTDRLELIVKATPDRPADRPELRFTGLAGDKVADAIGKAFNGYTLFIERTASEVPVPYTFDSIKEGTFRARGRSAWLDPSAAVPAGADASQTDLISGREFPAAVISGDPLTELTFSELPEDAQKIIEDSLRGLDLIWSDGKETFDVNKLTSLRFLITVNAKSNADDSTWTKYDENRVIEGRVSNRRFMAEIQLLSPPAELKAAVRELLLRTPAEYLETKARIISDRQGLSSLLFSQE